MTWQMVGAAGDTGVETCGLPPARAVDPRLETPGATAFTIATLVTDEAQYAAMRSSFAAGGFSGPDCEYLFIDNRPQGSSFLKADAYRGLNAMLAAARGDIVILCHQDVRLLADGRAALEARLAGLTERDAGWALAGNAGGIGVGRLALRISDPHGRDQIRGTLPARVQSLDENFIVVRRAAGVAFSGDLAGFHFYGADICQAARVLGWHSYVIDFHLEHLSPGRKDASFVRAATAFRAKWQRALAPRWVQTTCALVRLSGDRLGDLAGRMTAGPLSAIARRMGLR
ncbi:MAG: hypothetical protein R3D27_07400 [Hyphomicrobiaceae bacterium]